MDCTMGVFKLQHTHKPSTPQSSSTSTSTTSIPASLLPEPTYTPPNPTKKHHAKKQPAGHIPRPRNAFILFRCEFVRQKKIPQQIEKDHRNISRIVGEIWRRMNHNQREPWVVMADQERLAHSQLYGPTTSKFPAAVANKKSKRGDDIPGSQETQKPEYCYSWDDVDLLDLYRSTSCPPESVHANLESRGSTSHQSTAPHIGFTVADKNHYMEGQIEDSIHPHPGTPIPNHPPTWDVPPTQPHTWTDWNDFQFDQSSDHNETLATNTNTEFFTDPQAFLSPFPPFPNSYDSQATSYASHSSFTSLDTEPSSIYSPLHRYHLPDAPPKHT